MFVKSAYICGIRSLFAKFAFICGIRNNKLYLCNAESATKLMCGKILLYKYLYMGSTEILKMDSTYIRTCLKTFLWNPGTIRQQVLRLSNAQFGLVMTVF